MNFHYKIAGDTGKVQKEEPHKKSISPDVGSAVDKSSHRGTITNGPVLAKTDFTLQQ